MDTFLGSLVQSCCGEEGTLQTNNTGVCSQCLSHTGFAPPLPLPLPCSRHVCFPSLHCSGSRLLCWELSEVGPGSSAFPSSKPFRFRFSGIPQRHRLEWACVLCLFLVRAAQVTRCLAIAVAATYHLPVPAAQFSGCTTSAPSQVCLVSLLGS